MKDKAIIGSCVMVMCFCFLSCLKTGSPEKQTIIKEEEIIYKPISNVTISNSEASVIRNIEVNEAGETITVNVRIHLNDNKEEFAKYQDTYSGEIKQIIRTDSYKLLKLEPKNRRVKFIWTDVGDGDLNLSYTLSASNLVNMKINSKLFYTVQQNKRVIEF